MIIPESYLAHGLFSRGEERANHKYVARVPTGKNSYRYFYSTAEYKAYKMGKSVGNRIDKIKDQTSKTIQAYNNKVRASANKTRKQVNKFVGNAEKSVEKAANTAKKKVSDVLKDVRDSLDEHALTTEDKEGNTSTEHYGKTTTKSSFDINSVVSRNARKEAIAMNETKNYVAKNWYSSDAMLKSLIEDPEKFGQQWYYFDQQYGHGNNKKAPGDFGQSFNDIAGNFNRMRQLALKSPEAREAMRIAGREHEKYINQHGEGNREYAGAVHTTDKRTAAEKEKSIRDAVATASIQPKFDKVFSSKQSLLNAVRANPKDVAALIRDSDTLETAGISKPTVNVDKASKIMSEVANELSNSSDPDDVYAINMLILKLQEYGLA